MPPVFTIKYFDWFVVVNDHQLILNLFCFFVPVGPEAVFCFINFSTGHLIEENKWV